MEATTQKVICKVPGCHNIPLTSEAKAMVCSCGHRMKEHVQGKEHIECSVCGNADQCNECFCGHGAKFHVIEMI